MAAWNSQQKHSGKMEFEKFYSYDEFFRYGANVASSHVFIRLAFLRKVYGILTAQLAVTTAIGVMFLAIESLATFVKSNWWIRIVIFLVSIGLIIALESKGREFPINMQLLAAFTVCEAILVGVFVTYYSLGSVIEAFFLTGTVTLALTSYTLQSKRDMSLGIGCLIAALSVSIVVVLMQVFFPTSELLYRGCAAGGAIVFSLIIVYDTQHTMYKVSPEDYIYASILVYLDVLNLFIDLLRLLGKRNE